MPLAIATPMEVARETTAITIEAVSTMVLVGPCSGLFVLLTCLVVFFLCAIYTFCVIWKDSECGPSWCFI